jgi:hypothetical protein
MTFVDPLADFRTRLEVEKRDAAGRRTQRLAEQKAASNSPGIRLRVWEELHGLSLPREETHPLLGIIARDTGLTREQVLEEQRQRFAGAAKKTAEASQVWDPYCVHPDRVRTPPES